jgi:hypothetical protein
MSASPTHSATWQTTTIFPSCFLLHQCESTIPQANAVSTAESQVTALQYKHIKNFHLEIFTLIPLLRITCVFFRSFSLDGKGTKRSSRHECHPLCPPSDSGGKSKLDAYALSHAAVGGWPFTPLLHRMSASPTHSATWQTTTIFPSCFLLHQCVSTIPQANAVSTAESQVTALQYKHIKNFRMEIFTLIPLLRIACVFFPFLFP